MPNHLIFIVLDSCRYDSVVAAATPNMERIGAVEPRYAYASWTSPSHYTFLMGMVPHTSPQGVYASEVYKNEYNKWEERLGIENMSFQRFIPELWLPKILQDLGYQTIARVSLPVLNPFTPINRAFNDYKLMDHHNDFASMVDEMTFSDSRPYFYFLNLGETHYPYMLDAKELPHISGVHGVLKHLNDNIASQESPFFAQEQMNGLRQQQIRCVEYVDNIIGKLLAKTPANTHFIITADHGECFGEEGYFGHGPIVHKKVLEVPFLEGKTPA